MSNSDAFQILPGSKPGAFRVVGSEDEAQKWIPAFQEARGKLRAEFPDADELFMLVLTCTNAYRLLPHEILGALGEASRDPQSALVCFRRMAELLEFV